MVKKVLHFCESDPSEFVRRAAIDFISRWLCTGTLLTTCLVTVCRAIVHDVDCDVKCAAVRFWRQYLPTVEQSMTPLCCQTAVLAGSTCCLLSAVSDCDRTVRVEALRTLVDIHRLIETQLALMLLPKHFVGGKLFEDSHCNQVCSNTDFIKAGLRQLPQNIELEQSADETRSTVVVNCDGARGDKLSSFTDGETAYTESTLARLRVALLSRDWDALLASESQRSDDCHSNNPASLLDDILKTARRENELCNENDDENDNQDSIIIDCY